MPQTSSYIFAPSRQLWPGSNVNKCIPPICVGTDEHGEPQFISASTWLAQNKPVEQMTWAPGLPMVIHDRLTLEGGWIERKGVSSSNLYRPPPAILSGDAGAADKWLDHVKKIYPEPEEALHLISWLAHRVQHPEQKINHAIVLGGSQGIGKDTLLEPVKRAVGPWNFAEVSPQRMLGRFNVFTKAVILRISEAMKVYTAAPPDVLPVDEKNPREYYVTNCCGVIQTGSRTDGENRGGSAQVPHREAPAFGGVGKETAIHRGSAPAEHRRSG